MDFFFYFLKYVLYIVGASVISFEFPVVTCLIKILTDFI
jgi:hypothetical protein